MLYAGQLVEGAVIVPNLAVAALAVRIFVILCILDVSQLVDFAVIVLNAAMISVLLWILYAGQLVEGAVIVLNAAMISVLLCILYAGQLVEGAVIVPNLTLSTSTVSKFVIPVAIHKLYPNQLFLVIKV